VVAIYFHRSGVMARWRASLKRRGGFTPRPSGRSAV
jgi:hypothetical protein